ncbi:MAG TPA: biopolymer transporter ExbD [Elusimicrobiota bacterium]|nr:biopolymer transporter ExbD [Elusimicrobiota bacterium]
MKTNRSFSDTPISGVNIVPVIDLCLVMLIILMVMSPLMNTPNLPVKLPEARTKETQGQSITISYMPDGRMAVNTETIEKGELPNILKMLLKEQGDDVLVIIGADKEAVYGDLTELLKIVKQAGAQRIALGTQQIKD